MPRLWYCKNWQKRLTLRAQERYLKGQSNTIFDLQFFSPSYSNFYESPRGMILRRVNLPGVSYPGESNDFSRSYLKGQSNKIFDLFFS